VTDSCAALLVELFTEELPPRALRHLGQSFARQVSDALVARGLAAADSDAQMFATPRRLAVRVPAVAARAPDRRRELKGPSVKVALDASGQPTQALLKWAEKQGVEVASLRRGHDGRQECFFADSVARGEVLAEAIGPIVDEALARLPVPRLMQYQLADGHTTVSFVRPAHALTVLHGTEVLAATALGLRSGRTTFGHRFQSSGPITIDSADAYEGTLAGRGRVIAGFDTRRDAIERGLREQAARLQASLGDEAAVTPLLDEVTALVEWPAIYVGRFDAAFLEVPPECLILTMRTNQKYFPLFDAAGRLTPAFLIVSNMAVDDPHFIVEGNERVVRPRLADARFFFDQDRRATLASRVPQLASVVYHARLGSQAERAERVRRIAGTIATQLSIDAAACERAALLAKADLLTGMVGEFPELQGTMGRYYALHDGEAPAVAEAIDQHYRPRFAGDALPDGVVATVLALADKLETLCGLFGIGQLPTGDKDPFALRRHALGVLRMLIEKALPLPLDRLLDAGFAAFAAFVAPPADPRAELLAFFHDRLAGYLKELGFTTTEVAAVVDQKPMLLAPVPARLQAVRAFAALPQAGSLAAANKRIVNLLRKSASGDAASVAIDTALLEAGAERTLADLIERLSPQVEHRMQTQDYTGALTLLAEARDAVDDYFDHVMVMVDEVKVRDNRLALLARLRALMNQVADISRLSA
jgi:glycyl-tRNA synthetase beta chain